MEISKEDIEELIKIYKEDYGEELSFKEAADMGRRLVNLFKIIYKPLPDKDYQGDYYIKDKE